MDGPPQVGTMALGVEAVSLAVMVLFGVATAGFLAFMLRDVIAQFAAGPDGESPSEVDVAASQRLAMVGPAVYLVGFLVVVSAVLLDLETVAGVRPVDVGLLVILLAAVPMALAFYRVWERA